MPSMRRNSINTGTHVFKHMLEIHESSGKIWTPYWSVTVSMLIRLLLSLRRYFPNFSWERFRMSVLPLRGQRHQHTLSMTVWNLKNFRRSLRSNCAVFLWNHRQKRVHWTLFHRTSSVPWVDWWSAAVHLSHVQFFHQRWISSWIPEVCTCDTGDQKAILGSWWT